MSEDRYLEYSLKKHVIDVLNLFYFTRELSTCLFFICVFGEVLVKFFSFFFSFFFLSIFCSSHILKNSPLSNIFFANVFFLVMEKLIISLILHSLSQSKRF